MSEMIERVAKAIAAEFERQYDPGDRYVGKSSEGELLLDGTFDLGALARAAIAAMREPINDLADKATVMRYMGQCNGSPKSTWQTMIDFALVDEKS